MLAFDIEHEPQEISAAALQKLFDVCFDNSDTISLSSAPWDGLDDRLERALKPFLLHQMDTMRWFCYYVPDYNKLHMKIYPLNEQTKQILRTHYLGLFWMIGARTGRIGIHRWKTYASSGTESSCLGRSRTSTSVWPIRRTIKRLRSASRTPFPDGKNPTGTRRSRSRCPSSDAEIKLPPPKRWRQLLLLQKSTRTICICIVLSLTLDKKRKIGETLGSFKSW